MSELLVPIAISSQLDVTGEERIHASQYTKVTRPTFVGHPAMTIDKILVSNADEDETGDVTEGDTLSFTATVTNTGDSTLHNVTITDDHTDTTQICERVIAGGTCVLSYDYVVTADDVTATEIVNTSSAVSDELTSPITDSVTTPVTTPASPMFVAVGLNGMLATSPDAINWTLRTSGTSNHLLTCTYGDGLFIACGNVGTAISSSDGINWSPISTSPGATGRPCIGSPIPAYILNKDFGGGILISSDGVNYSVSTDVGFYTGCYADEFEILLAVGRILHRTDDGGGTWQTFNTINGSGGLSTACITDNGINYVVGCTGGGAGAPVIQYSNTGTSWTTARTSNSGVSCLVYGNGTHIAFDGTILRSTDRLTLGSWSVISHPSISVIRGMCFGDNKFLAAGDSGDIIYSTDDGLTWSLANNVFGSNGARDIAFGMV